jgi:cell division protein FtsB
MAKNKKEAVLTDEETIEIEVLREEYERLAAENAQLRQEVPSIVTAEFEYGGLKYEFVSKGFRLNGQVVKAAEVRKNLDIQRYLVESGSGLIRESGTQTTSEDEA